MGKPTNKSNRLTEYLLLFIMFQGINLTIIVVGFLKNLKGHYLMSMAGSSSRIFSLLSISLSLFDIILTSLVILYFLKRNQGFIKMYIASTIYKVLIAIFEMTIILPLLMADNGFFNVTNVIMSIAFHIVMLIFWLNYFKSSMQLKIYLKSKQDTKKNPRKFMKAKRKLRLIK